MRADNGAVLTQELLEEMAKKLKGPNKSVKEKILDKYEVTYIKENLDNIYLLMPEKYYLKNLKLAEEYSWIVSDPYSDNAYVVDTTDMGINLHNKVFK